MKRAMVYLIAVSALLTALLSGCGENIIRRQNTTGTKAPQTSAAPEETLMPDASDGIVNDTDGIITDDDNGGTLIPDGKLDTDQTGKDGLLTPDTESGNGSTTVGPNTMESEAKTKLQ